MPVVDDIMAVDWETELSLNAKFDNIQEDEEMQVDSVRLNHTESQFDDHAWKFRKKRRFPASIRTRSSLRPVAEESPFHNPNFKLARLPKNGLAPEIDLSVEIRPTQTQKPPVLDQPVDHITESIRTQLKAHFDTAGSLPRLESLNQLASRMNKKRASHLFYQTCVLD
ncbi:hypothetical protein Leryth_016730 [Lithospermum erythrorhizon]|nr:hypothetical protein Leryth_016730 [Lithospermum erythrorhizon]